MGKFKKEIPTPPWVTVLMSLTVLACIWSPGFWGLMLMSNKENVEQIDEEIKQLQHPDKSPVRWNREKHQIEWYGTGQAEIRFGSGEDITFIVGDTPGDKIIFGTAAKLRIEEE
jgi:hypothetical protein